MPNSNQTKFISFAILRRKLSNVVTFNTEPSSFGRKASSPVGVDIDTVTSATIKGVLASAFLPGGVGTPEFTAFCESLDKSGVLQAVINTARAAATQPTGSQVTSRSASQSIRASRQKAADEAFANYDFGADKVTDSDSWTEDGPYWSRWVYGDAEGGGRFRASFGVEFKADTSEIVEKWVEND